MRQVVEAWWWLQIEQQRNRRVMAGVIAAFGQDSASSSTSVIQSWQSDTDNHQIERTQKYITRNRRNEILKQHGDADNVQT
jgi:hypothetical protein